MIPMRRGPTPAGCRPLRSWLTLGQLMNNGAMSAISRDKAASWTQIEIDVSIVTYNSKQHLPRLIEAVETDGGDPLIAA